MLQIRCKNNNVTKSFPEGCSLLDVYQEFADEIQMPYPVVSAKVNNASQGLKFRLYQNRDVEFVDARAGSGHRVYVRSLCFVLYKATHDEEYLERARLFAEWFVRRTLDRDGWHVSRVFFTKQAHDRITSRPGGENIDEFANVQGYFQGGGLNFFKLLAETSGDGKWVSDMYLRMADLLVDRMQEPCGNYNSVKIATKEFNPPKYVRDDFCSLGLIGAYKLTKNPKYIQSVEKYLRYAFSIQLPDGSFKDDDSIASIPEILNAAYEAEGLMDTSFIHEDAVKSAFDFLFKRQYDGWLYRKMAGGFIEETFVDINSWPPPVFTIHLRGTSYATLFLLKMATGKAVGIEA